MGKPTTCVGLQVGRTKWILPDQASSAASMVHSAARYENPADCRFSVDEETLDSPIPPGVGENSEHPSSLSRCRHPDRAVAPENLIGRA